MPFNTIIFCAKVDKQLCEARVKQVSLLNDPVRSQPLIWGLSREVREHIGVTTTGVKSETSHQSRLSQFLSRPLLEGGGEDVIVARFSHRGKSSSSRERANHR